MSHNPAKFSKFFGCIFMLLILFFKLSAQLPSGFLYNNVQAGYTAPMGIVFSSNGNSMFVWDKSGHLYVSKWNGSSYIKQAATVLDISGEVGDWRDFGLLSVCLDPDFDQNGLVYLYYVVDRHYLLYFGTSQYNPAVNEYFNATIGRVTRYKLNLGTTITTDYSSRKILLGESKKTGVPLLHESHMGGTLIFGRDKTLLLSVGDGASYALNDMGSAAGTYYQQALQDSIIRPEENVGDFRSQMINSHNGKVLRFDPNTGDGIASNPFFDGANPRSPKSRMWAMGFRNPFRMSFQANTGSTNPADADPGTLLLGDVGMGTWEEINIISKGGLNFGWPLYEGEVPLNSFFNANTVNQDEGLLFKNLCLQPTSFTINPIITNRRYTHYRPSVAWKHGTTPDARVPWFNGTTPTDPQVGAVGSPTAGGVFNGNCVIGGLYYTGTAFGSNYQNMYFFADFGVNWIKTANLNTVAPWINKISNFAPENFTQGIVDMEQNPLDNSIYYVNINTGQIMRISLGGNLPPVAAISSNVNSGPSPLTVNFSSAGSIAPQGSPLTYLWDFGDGANSTEANPSHTFTGTGIGSFTVTLTVTDTLSLFSSKSLVISINNSAPTVSINNPINNSTYSILNETELPLTASVTDDETTTGMQYAWEVTLRHNNHEHREPVITDANPIVQISPVGCDGETYYYVIQLTVTDNGGLIAKDSVKIYPNCSTGGLAITNLQATSQNNNALLSWNNPSVSFDEVMVAAQPSTSFLTNPAGTNYIADANFAGIGSAFEQGKIVYRGNGQSVNITNLQFGTTYYFRVFTRIGNVWTGGVETSVIILPSLTGVGLLSSATVDLSTEGISDWAHWPGYDHKSTGGNKISNYSIVGNKAIATYNNDLRSCSWNDGTPTIIGSNQSGVYVAGIGNGFQITAPADQTRRTLKVYVGGWQSGGTLTAQLSDGSSADYINTSFSTTGQYSAVYTLTYNAASAGKLLTVKWVQSSGIGNVTLQAATLVQSGPVVNVTGVTVSPTSATLAISNTQQLTATIAPANASNQNVSWSSSNNAAATVNTSGLVTAVAAGTATITATTQDGNKTATCNITCTSIAVTGVTVNPPSAILSINSTHQLTATIAPASASNQNVSWSSSNNAVATVS
jgi:glucose/arabinose dehydrogenase/PKD repeat protein